MEIKDFVYFYSEKPFLITIGHRYVKKFSSSFKWIAEKKYNGIRLQLHYLNGKFLFFGRHNNKLNFKPNDELLNALNKLNIKGYCIFDGELRNNKVKGIKQRIILYDVFIFENNLLKVSFSERRKILESILEVEGDPIGITKQYKNNFHKTFKREVREEEIEGIVIKNLNGKLELGANSGKSSNWMFKIRKPTKNYKF